MSELAQVVTELEGHGHRLTAARLTVLAAVYAAAAPFAAEEINRDLPRVGRATVFRTIKLLVDEGVLCRVLMEDGHLVYSWSHRGHHHHVICKSCGEVQDLNRCGVPGLLADVVRAAGYSMEGHWLEVYGRCASCRAAAGDIAGESVGAASTA